MLKVACPAHRRAGSIEPSTGSTGAHPERAGKATLAARSPHSCCEHLHHEITPVSLSFWRGKQQGCEVGCCRVRMSHATCQSAWSEAGSQDQGSWESISWLITFSVRCWRWHWLFTNSTSTFKVSADNTFQHEVRVHGETLWKRKQAEACLGRNIKCLLMEFITALPKSKIVFHSNFEGIGVTREGDPCRGRKKKPNKKE